MFWLYCYSVLCVWLLIAAIIVAKDGEASGIGITSLLIATIWPVAVPAIFLFSFGSTLKKEL